MCEALKVVVGMIDGGSRGFCDGRDFSCGCIGCVGESLVWVALRFC